MRSYPRGSELGRHGCRVRFGNSRTNRSRDIRAAHFDMDDERRSRTKVNTYGRTPFDVLPENSAWFAALIHHILVFDVLSIARGLPYRQSKIMVISNGIS